MSASGKSSNRHSEYSRARLGGGGHGIYAEAGRRDRERAQAARAARAEPVTPLRAKPTPAPAPRPTKSSSWVPLVVGAAIGLVIDRVLHRATPNQEG